MAIKLLLVEDVDDLGRSGDIVGVKPGYARNFLIPQGFAVLADKRALRMQAKLQEERKKRAIIDKKEAETQAANLEGIVLTEIVKVDQEGHMYGSVTGLDIVRMLSERHQIQLEKKNVQLKTHLKELGVHPIVIKLKEGITSTITLKIVSEATLKEEQAAAAAAAKEATENKK